MEISYPNPIPSGPRSGFKLSQCEPEIKAIGLKPALACRSRWTTMGCSTTVNLRALKHRLLLMRYIAGVVVDMGGPILFYHNEKKRLPSWWARKTAELSTGFPKRPISPDTHTTGQSFTPSPLCFCLLPVTWEGLVNIRRVLCRH